MIISALLLASASTHVQPALTRAGDCGWVHGDYRASNGSRIHRIWMAGTNHKLNLDVSDESSPRFLNQIWAHQRYSAFEDDLVGDFYVCANERRIPGHMQEVHLKRTKNLHVVK
jgi:hypothetical protein